MMDWIINLRNRAITNRRWIEEVNNMPLELNELENLSPASARSRGVIVEDELVAMLNEGGYSAKEVSEFFKSAHGSANSALTKLFIAKVAGRVQKGASFYYSAWDNFSAKQQKAFDTQIVELIAEQERKAAEKAAEKAAKAAEE